MTSSFDVAIIGGGIAGFSLAHFLAPHRKVLVLERESAFGYHATGRSAAEFAFRFHTPLVGKLAALSFSFLKTPPTGFTNTPMLHERGMILIAAEEKQARLDETFELESAITDRLKRLSIEQATNLAPILNPNFFNSAFFDPDCWDIDVESLFHAYQKSAQHSGARALRNAELISVARSGGVWSVETTAGQFSAQTIVNAAGAWADEIALLTGATPLNIQPLRRTVITVDIPAEFDIRTMPEIQEVDEDFYMKPDAGKLMLSPADENETAACDAQPEELDIAWAMHWLTQATTLEPQRPSHTWAGLRTFAPDRMPVVGWDTKVEGLFWLAGQGGFGIQTSPAIGKYVAERLLGSKLSDDFQRQHITRNELDPVRFIKTKI